MKIAILLATYMGEKYIGEQIDSIINQSYKDWKIFVHDDGSRDNTLGVVQAYQEKYPDKIEILDGSSTGCARNNFLYIMSRVEAPYYMCCDQDDVWLPEKIEKTFGKMQELEQDIQKEKVPCLVFTDLKVVDGELNVIAERMSEYQNLAYKNTSVGRMLMQNVITGCTMMMNRRLRDLTIQYHNVENIIMHDWWSGIIAAYFGKVGFVDESTILYRQHGNNSVGALDSRSFSFIIKKIKDFNGNKTSIENTQKQAQEFVNTFGLERESIPAKLAYAKELPKLKRLKMYKENDLRKNGVARNIGLMIWG